MARCSVSRCCVRFGQSGRDCIEPQARVARHAAQQAIERRRELVAGARRDQLVEFQIRRAAIGAGSGRRRLLDGGHLERRGAQRRKAREERLDGDPHLDHFHRIGGAHQIFAIVTEQRLALGFGRSDFAVGPQRLTARAATGAV